MGFTWNPDGSSWEAMASLHDSPFADSRLQIEVCEAEELSEHDRRFVREVVEALPDLMPDIVLALKRYEEDLANDEVFRTELCSPGLLFDLDSMKNAKEWAFTVERPSRGPTSGYHVEFAEWDFRGIWAGD